MVNAPNQVREKDFRKSATPLDIQGITPRAVNWVAIPTRAPNQAKVSHACFSLKQSSHSSTPDSRSTDRPIIAATTLAMFNTSLHIQN